MSLNKTNFQNDLALKLKDNFKKGKDEAWSSDKAADELAKAIADAVDEYVREGEVEEVITEVKNPGGTIVIGHGKQTGSVKLI